MHNMPFVSLQYSGISTLKFLYLWPVESFFFFFFPLATFQKLAAALRQTIQSCTVIEDCFDAVNYQINIRVWSS